MIRNRDQLATTNSRELALRCIEAGIAASDPAQVLDNAVTCTGDMLQINGTSFDLSAYEEVLVVGGGKASGEQARVIADMLGDTIDAGLVITRDDLSIAGITVRVGDHPVPSERGVTATAELLSLLEGANEETLVLALITGGGSALLPAPADGITLSDVQTVTEALLSSGATIHEINAVRKHLSAIKGGGLARAAAPATVVGLLMSDVVGDDLSVIASGPTVPDPTTFQDARDVLDRYAIDVSASIDQRLQDGIDGILPETPGPHDPVFDQVTNVLTADSATPIRAAMSFLEDQADDALFLSSRIQGESREAAKSMVAIGEEIRVSGHPCNPPVVVLSGGETTVTINGDGQGGPNQEFALSAAIAGSPGITIAAVDTDGIDGTSPAAGGIVDADTVTDVTAARDALADNDAYGYLRDHGAILETGPTGTNVNDFRVMVVEPK